MFPLDGLSKRTPKMRVLDYGRVLIAAGSVLSAVLLPSAEAAVGNMVFSVGNVVIRSQAGVDRPGTLGAPIEVGDSIVTNDGRAQVRFSDDGYMSFQPATIFRVDDYNYDKRANVAEKAIFNLVKGGLRAVTGLIGKRNKGDYQVNTTVATIGIRGTTYQALLCAGGSCAVPDGLYVKGGEGTVFVANGFGSIDLTRGTSAFVPSAKSAPQETTATPRVTAPASVTTPVQFAVRSEFPAGDYVAPVIGFNFTGPFTTINFTGGGGAAATTGGTVGLSGTVNGGAIPVPGVISGQGGIAAAAGKVNPSDVSAATITLSGVGVIGVSVISPLGGASITTTNFENAGTDGSLYWGRWANAKIFVVASGGGQSVQGIGTLSGATGVAYVFGTQAATMPFIGSATYQFSGGPPSTSDGGSTGAGVTGGTLIVNFGTSTVNLNMTVNHNGIYNLNTGRMFLDATNRAQFDSLPFNSSGAGVYPSSVKGFFSGANAVPQSAGLAYQIQKPSDFINGVAGFACKTGC
jgi:hypothetical protein